MQEELKQMAVLEERLHEKDIECESLADEIEHLKEQVMLHKYRLLPKSGGSLTESD